MGREERWGGSGGPTPAPGFRISPSCAHLRGKAAREEAPLVPAPARAQSARWPQRSRNTLSSSVGGPPHSITSVGDGSTDSEHGPRTTDLYLTPVSSCSRWQKLLEYSALEWYPRRGLESYLLLVALWCRPPTVKCVTLVLCPSTVSLKKQSAEEVLPYVIFYTTESGSWNESIWWLCLSVFCTETPV